MYLYSSHHVVLRQEPEEFSSDPLLKVKGANGQSALENIKYLKNKYSSKIKYM